MNYIIFHSNNNFHYEIFQIENENFLPLFGVRQRWSLKDYRPFLALDQWATSIFLWVMWWLITVGIIFKKMNWTMTRKRPKRLNFELNTHIPRQNEALGVKFSSKIVSRSFKVIQDKKSRKKAKEKLEMANLIKNFTNHTSKWR